MARTKNAPRDDPCSKTPRDTLYAFFSFQIAECTMHMSVFLKHHDSDGPGARLYCALLGFATSIMLGIMGYWYICADCRPARGQWLNVVTTPS